jgi:hypothetical protein
MRGGGSSLLGWQKIDSGGIAAEARFGGADAKPVAAIA